MRNIKLFSTKNKKRLHVTLFVFTTFLSSCAVSLAPKFDQAIVDNLSSASSNIFELFAAVSDGTKKDDYSTRDAQYNQVIGQLEALELQINARPVPQNKSLDKVLAKVNDRLKQKGIAPIDPNESAPSATAIKNINDNITKMKDTDKLQGLTKLEVQAFKNNVQLYLDQALTYERYLSE